MKKMVNKFICGICFQQNGKVIDVVKNQYDNYVCSHDKKHTPFIQVFEWKEVKDPQPIE